MDDDKKTGNGNQSNETTQDEEKLAKIIPFDGGDEAKSDSEKKADAEENSDASLTEAMDMLKSAFGELKKQLEPLKETFLELTTAIRESLAEATKEVQTATEETLKANAEAHAADNIVSTGLKAFKMRADETGLNLHEIVSREFAQFADKKLDESEYTIGADGKKHVVIDSKFLEKHGADVVPSLIKNTFRSLAKTLVGESNLEDVLDKQMGTDLPKTEEKPAETTETDSARGDYQVEFDFADNWSAALHDVKIAPGLNPQGEKTEDAAKSERVRELFVEGGRILQDALNGNEIGDTGERMRKAVAKVDVASDEELNEDQARIIELSKQYEKSMNPDKKDE